ncbi:MAG: hypothetical protein ACRDXB_10630, partial [Actinomycetes bacterium]
TEAPTVAALLAGRCDVCRHTLSKHHNDAGCVIPLCTCGRFQPAADQPDTETEATPDPADLNRQLSTICSCGHALRWHLPDCRKGSGHGCHCLSFTP